MKIKFSKAGLFFIIFVALTSIPSIIQVISGSTPFWFDPARDLLSAQENLKKLSLLGPPTGGVPGVFYGPYWIWIQSLVLIFSKNPRIISLLVMTLPYIVVFPIFLWRLNKIIGKFTVFILWFLFINSFRFYSTYLWNPYLAPVFFIALTYLITSLKNNSERNYLIFFICAICAAFVANFSLSFGIGIIAATTLYLGISCLLWKKPQLMITYFAGLGLIFLPTIVFEVRHNFLQSRLFFNAFINSALYNSAITGGIGMNRQEILKTIISIPAQILSVSIWQFLLFAVILTVLTVYLKKKKILNKITLNDGDKKLLFFLFLCLGAVYLFYFLTKNPIWSYHFIGIEVIFLLLLGLGIAKIRPVNIVVAIWSAILFVGFLINLVLSPFPEVYTTPSLASKELIVNSVFENTGSDSFSEFTFSPAIYTFDFDYLFANTGAKNKSSLIKDSSQAKAIYLIIPTTSPAKRDDFIHYKTPDLKYVTIWQKTFRDGTIVLKRVAK